MTASDRALRLVRKATAGAEGTPDWNTILEILSALEAAPVAVRAYLQALHSVLNTGSHATRMNALILVDALFKNCKKERLPELQAPALFRALGLPGIADDPDLHNFLARSVPAWVANCAKGQCLDPALGAYREAICRDLFAPKLTAAVLAKLQGDVETAFEVLELMAQLLAAGGGDRAIVAEVLPNVREIGRRAGELEQVVVDACIHPLLAGLRRLSLACQQGVSNIGSGKPFDADRLLHEVLSGQAAARARRAAAPPDAARPAARRRRAGDDEMSVGDFFKRFDSLKDAPAASLLGGGEPAAAVRATDSLIDF